MIIELWQTGFRNAWHRAQWGDGRAPARAPSEPVIVSRQGRSYHINDRGTDMFQLDYGGLTQSPSDWLQVTIDHEAKTWGFRYNAYDLWHGERFPFDNQWHIRTVRVMMEQQVAAGASYYNLQYEWVSVMIGRLRWRIVQPIYRDPADVALQGINKLIANAIVSPEQVREQMRQLRREITMARLGG